MLFDRGRLETLLAEREAAGLIALSPPNIFYLTEWRKSGGAAAVAARDALRLVVRAADLDFVLEGVPDEIDVAAYGEFVRFTSSDVSLSDDERRVAGLHEGVATDTSFESCLGSAIPEGTGTYLCDAGEHDCEALSASLGRSIRSDPEAFGRLRAVKTDEELRRLSIAAEVAEAAIAEVVSSCREGATQAELARAFNVSVATAGARTRLDNVSLGRSTAFGNANVPQDRLRRGGLVRFDVGAIVDGYESDMARCFAFGELPEKFSSYYEALLAGEQAALDILQPGVRASDLFKRGVETVKESGIPHYARTNVGHGIGIHGDGYDPPLLTGGNDSLIEAGMVLCVETPYYELGFGGLQVEDMVVVTDDGYEMLTTSSRALEVIG